MPQPPRAPGRRRLPAAPVWLAGLLLVLAVLSVGVGGSGLDRAGSIVQVASGPDTTRSVSSLSQAEAGEAAARLDAAVLGGSLTQANGRDSGAGQDGERGERGSGTSSGDAGTDRSSGTPAAPSSGTPAGAGADPSGPGAGTGSPAGGGSEGGLGDTADDTAGGVTDPLPDVSKPLPVPGDVVDGILGDPKLPGRLDGPGPPAR